MVEYSLFRHAPDRIDEELLVKDLLEFPKYGWECNLLHHVKKTNTMRR